MAQLNWDKIRASILTLPMSLHSVGFQLVIMADNCSFIDAFPDLMWVRTHHTSGHTGNVWLI